MKKHTKIYLDYFDNPSFIICENCNTRKAVDIHHIKYRSRGGKDNIENLMALCRECHNDAHNEILKEEYLLQKHKEWLK